MQQFAPDAEIDLKEIEKVISEVDTDDTGTVDFPKFLRIMERTNKKTESLTDQVDVMQDAFGHFTAQGGDGSGFGPAELQKVMASMGENLTDTEV